MENTPSKPRNMLLKCPNPTGGKLQEYLLIEFQGALHFECKNVSKEMLGDLIYNDEFKVSRAIKS